jgi:hypothetical protein
LARRDGLFRGSEFPRLLLLLGLMVVGWPLALYYVWTRPPEPAAPRPVAEAPLPPPDPAPEFQGIEDRRPLLVTDNPAYALLWKRVRETSPAALASRSRRDIVFSQLLGTPARFRGVPIHVEGTARRILLQDEVSPRIVPGGKFYEAYVFTPDSQGYPYLLAFEDAPPGLVAGDNVDVRVWFDGYFLKLMRYQAADVPRVAPLLIGRLGVRAESVPAPATPWGRASWPLLALMALFSYVVIRWAFQVKRVLSPSRPARTGPSPSDAIAPEALEAWVRGEPAGPEPPQFPETE